MENTEKELFPEGMTWDEARVVLNGIFKNGILAEQYRPTFNMGVRNGEFYANEVFSTQPAEEPPIVVEEPQASGFEPLDPNLRYYAPQREECVIRAVVPESGKLNLNMGTRGGKHYEYLFEFFRDSPRKQVVRIKDAKPSWVQDIQEWEGDITYTLTFTVNAVLFELDGSNGHHLLHSMKRPVTDVHLNRIIVQDSTIEHKNLQVWQER